jgi:hypothetical protein
MRAGDWTDDDDDDAVVGSCSCTEDEANCGLFFPPFLLLLLLLLLLFWCLHVLKASMHDAAFCVHSVLHVIAWSAQPPDADIGIDVGIDVDDPWHGMPAASCGVKFVCRGGVFVIWLVVYY